LIYSHFSYSSWFETFQGSRDVFIIQINASDGSLLNGYQDGSVEEEQINSLAFKGDSLFFAGFRFYFLFLLFLYVSDESFYSSSNGQYDVILGKMNLTTFNITKTVQNGTNQAEELTSIEVDSSGNVVVGGWTYGDWFGQNKGGKDLLLMKYDSDLNLIWGWQYGKNDHDLINDLSIDLFDDIWIGGETESSLFSSNQGDEDGFIAKIKSEGSLIFGRQSEFSTTSPDLITSIAMNSRNNLIIGGYTAGTLFSLSLGGYDIFIADFGCDPGYINVEAHCESATFSPTFSPTFDPTFDPTFNPTFNPTQTIIYFDLLTHSLGVFWSQAYQPSDLNLNYSSSSQPPLFGSHISPPFNSSSNQQQEDPLLFSSPGVDGSGNERGRLSLMNDPLNFSSFEEAGNFLSSENEIISSLDWIVDYFNSQTFIFYYSNNSIFMSNVINNKIENITQIPHQLNGSYVFSPSSSNNNNNNIYNNDDDNVILDQVGNSSSSFMGSSGSFYLLSSSLISEEFGERMKNVLFAIFHHSSLKLEMDLRFMSWNFNCECRSKWM